MKRETRIYKDVIAGLGAISSVILFLQNNVADSIFVLVLAAALWLKGDR